MVDSGRQQWQEVSEISPFLLRALTELNKLAHEENKAADNKESILEDLVHLERIMAEKLAEIRAKIDQL
jgi:Leucine-rich repeat (LRR) protein